MRLGELLLEHKAITASQLEAALRSQAQFRGRLGTRLADLGFVDIDTVSRALSTMHRTPPLLRKHIKAVEAKVVACVPRRLAVAHKVVPVGYTPTKPARLVVASPEPWTLPIDELAFAAGVRVDAWIGPQGLIDEALERYYGVAPAARRYVDMSMEAWKAPEKMPEILALSDMVEQQNAAVMQVWPPDANTAAPASQPMHSAMNASRSHSLPPASQAQPMSYSLPPASQAQPPMSYSVPPASQPLPPMARAPQPLDLRVPSLDGPALMPPGQPAVPSLSPGPYRAPPPAAAPAPEVVPPSAAVPLPVVAPLPTAAALPTAPAVPAAAAPLRYTPPSLVRPPAAVFAPLPLPSSLSHAVVQPERTPSEPPPAAATPAPLPLLGVPTFPPVSSPNVQFATDDDVRSPVTAPPDVLLCPVIDRDEALALLQTALTKDDVGQVLVDWLRSTFGCGLVLIVKDGSALGWKGFFPPVENDVIEAATVPLGSKNMLSIAFETRAPFVGLPPAEGASLHMRFWKLLRCSAPSSVLVCPVVLGTRVVNLLYAHPDSGGPIAPQIVEDAVVVCREAADAYARAVRLAR